MKTETGFEITGGRMSARGAMDPRVVDLLGQNELWSRIDVIGIRPEERAIEAYVPHTLVDNEEVPVGEKYAESLAKSMRNVAQQNGGGTGQTTAIVLGYIEGEDRLRIMDGFHRNAGLIFNSSETVYATIKRVTWEELYDFRIFNAKDNPNVRFSRVVQWMKEVWAHSGLDEEISLRQAILLTRFDTDGSKHGLSQEYVEETKLWITQRESQWGIASMTILEFLKIADYVDPKLVHSAREKTDGKTLDAPTQSILKVFSKEIPNNYELQNLVMDTAMQHNLKGPEVTAVCREIKRCDTLEEAQHFLDRIDWEKWEPAFGDTKNRQLRRRYDPRHKGASVLDTAGLEIENIIKRTKAAADSGEPLDGEIKRNLAEATRRVDQLKARLGYLANMMNGLATTHDPRPLFTKPSIQQAGIPQIKSKPVVPKPSFVHTNFGEPAAAPVTGLGVSLIDVLPEETHGDQDVTTAEAPGGEVVDEGPSPEALQAQRIIQGYKQTVRDYLNEITDDLPTIGDKAQLRHVLAVLREAFSGDPARIGQVQGVIDEFNFGEI